MDPITHAIIGAGVFALSGGDISLAEPALIGCIAGSVAPDLDIAAKMYNDYYYLKHHRGSSHSFAGVLMIGLGVAAVLSLLFSGSSFLKLFGWTFAGGFTHILFDLLNSYGAQLFWPVSKKKYSLSLLKIFDLVIVTLGAAAILFNRWPVLRVSIVIIFGLYVTLLGIMRRMARRKVMDFFKARVGTKSIKVLPSMFGFFNWDFILIGQKHATVGRVDLLRSEVKVHERLRMPPRDEADKFMDNRVAGFFKEFTPIYHMKVKKTKDITEVIYTDLRYRMKNRFMHHATAVFNPKGKLVESTFHPFNINRRVRF